VRGDDLEIKAGVGALADQPGVVVGETDDDGVDRAVPDVGLEPLRGDMGVRRHGLTPVSCRRR
jgi:hypothetical protein